MKKLGSKTVLRLQAQAEEAKELGLFKLAESVEGVLYNDNFQLDTSTYSNEKLEDEIYQAMWRTAASLITFHDVQNPDVMEIEKVAGFLTKYVLNEMRVSLQVPSQIGANEPALPGEIKK